MSRAIGMFSPTVGSVTFKVCLFLAANPDEYLNIDDIAVKFGAPKRSMTDTLKRGVACGLLAQEVGASRRQDA